MSKKAKGNIISITGASGAGRSTVVAVLKNNYPDFVTVTGVTTRAARPGEVEGQHYYFVTTETFEQDIKNDCFISWQQQMDNYYGIYKNTVTQLLADGKTVILEFPLGEEINEVKKLYPNANTISMHIIPHNVDSMVRRLITRENKDMDRVHKRLNVYEAEAYTALKADVILVNEHPEETAEIIARIVENPNIAKKYYDEYVELVVQLKKALKEYKADSRFTIKNGCLEQYAEDSQKNYTVEIPNGVTCIGDGAFRWCEYLTEVRIPHSVIDIGNGAFLGCECLKSITIPRSVKSIGNEAFMGCIELNNVRIPNSIKAIANGVFRSCSEISRIHIPDSVTTIGEDAFSGCVSLSSISLPDGLTQIGPYAFSNCNSITRFIIPMGLSGISAGMFFRCYSLLDVNIPNTIEEIGDQAFDGCRHLTDVAIPEATVRIGAWSFADCAGLRNVTFANDATKIDEHAFENCTSLSHISLPRKAPAINEGTFEGCTSLEDVVLPSHLITIGKNAFKGCYQLKHIVIPLSVTTIKQGAFADCRRLRCVEIPESVVSIEDHVFDGCYALKIKAVPGSFAERYAKENRIDVEYNSTSADNETLREYLDRRFDAIDGGLINIQNNLNEMRNFATTELQAWLKKEKGCLQDNAPSYDEDVIASSISKTNFYIAQQVSRASLLIEEQTMRLSEIFGTTWTKLPDDTKKALISAGVLWRSCAGIDDKDFDYSGICIATSSGLEAALKTIFYTDYQDYLIKTYGPLAEMKNEDIYRHWPQEMLNIKKKCGGTVVIKPGNYFTMGTLPYLFYKEEKPYVREEMDKYLRTILKKPENITAEDWNPIDMLDLFINKKRDPNSFVSRCGYVKKAYRDPAAHSGVIVYDTAKACSDTIIGRVDALNQNVRVYGLLMELYSVRK